MKGLIVIDNIPDRCESCPIVRIKWNRKTNIEVCECPLKEYEYIGYDDKKPSWCPLKPMPEKKAPSVQLSARHNDEHMEILGFRYDDYEKGWNACLEEIENDIT